MEAQKLRVVGIDPAPRRGLTVFDGHDYHVPIWMAAAFLNELAAEKAVLICWDAPLTGPTERALAGERAGSPSDFTQRPIEQFFSREKTGFRAPSGISVMPYAGCPHWALTRHLLGLPRVGPWDEDFHKLPFRLATSDQPPRGGRWVVEVHPAVAAWLWCRDGWGASGWKYKKEPQVRRLLWSRLAEVLAEQVNGVSDPADDDEVDARIAYALGRMWLSGLGQVILLGDLDQGTFLLPNVPTLLEAFERFTRTE